MTKGGRDTSMHIFLSFSLPLFLFAKQLES